MPYRSQPDASMTRPSAWRALLLWALMTALTVAGFAVLRALEGDVDIVQGPPGSAPRA